MSGTLPHELSYLNESLVELNLGGGSISGPIPSSFQKMSKLETVYLNDHCLSGAIPDFSQIPTLTGFFVHNNLELSGSMNGFCEGSEYKEGTVAIGVDCGCPGSGGESLIECDCCLCCNQDKFECCDKNGNSWNSYNLGELSSNGFIKSFDKACLSEKSKRFIHDECPCVFDTTPNDTFAFFGQCTNDCTIEGAIQSYNNTTTA